MTRAWCWLRALKYSRIGCCFRKGSHAIQTQPRALDGQHLGLCMCVRLCVHAYVNKCVCMCIYAFVHQYVCGFVCLYVYMCVCTCVCLYMHICVCLHEYIHYFNVLYKIYNLVASSLITSLILSTIQ